MGLDATVRAAIATISTATADLQATVAHAAWTGKDGYNKPSFAAPVSRQALVEMKQRLRRLPNGQEVLQQAAVTFIGPISANGATGRREPVDPRDTITLPNGYSGPILNVEGLIDPTTNRPFMVQVWLG